MRFYAHERVALVVDGPKFFNAYRDLNIDIDFDKLQGFFARQGTLVSASYFTPLVETEDFNPVRRLVDWLEFHSWQVITRPKHTEVDLAVFAMEMGDRLDHMVIATGNGDFVGLIEALQRKACRVSILSTIKATTHCSEELRRAADQFIEIEDLREAISRPARAAVTA